MEITVPVEPTHPTTPANCVRNACNIVRLDVNHRKGRGITACAYPAELKPNGIMSVLITSGEYLLLAPATRLNRKQVAIWEETAKNHVALRQGCIWDLVLKVCENVGLHPTPTQQEN